MTPVRAGPPRRITGVRLDPASARRPGRQTEHLDAVRRRRPEDAIEVEVGFRPTELAERVGASKQAINPIRNELERWGYLERRPDETDQRGRVIRLTDHGRAFMADVGRLHAELEADWGRELGPERFETLRSALRELVERHAGPPATG